MPILSIPEDGLEIEVPSGANIQDVCDHHDTSILFSCFSARCGICRIQILRNPAGLSNPTHSELELLAMMDARPDERLACQCNVVDDVSIHPLRQM